MLALLSDAWGCTAYKMADSDLLSLLLVVWKLSVCDAANEKEAAGDTCVWAFKNDWGNGGGGGNGIVLRVVDVDKRPPIMVVVFVDDDGMVLDGGGSGGGGTKECWGFMCDW